MILLSPNFIIVLPLFKQVQCCSLLRPSNLTNVELAWYCTVDSKEQVRAVFLRLDVKVLVFYRFPKSFYPDVVFCAPAAVHTDLAFRGNQSFAGISIPNCLDTRLANIRAGECKGKARFVSAERRRMKP